jgi:FtsH-binding integral membrane protein
MASVYKTLLLGLLATSFLAAVVAVSANLLDVSGEIAGLMVVLGAAGAGLIGGRVSRRLPPPQRRH